MKKISLCVVNQKGGCGKSSTCFHLSGSLAAIGYNILLIDADPQGSLSQGFFGSTFVENLPSDQTVAALFDESNFFLDFQQIVRDTGIANISIVPANQHLAQFNNPKPELEGITQFAIRDFLESQTEFDAVIIDCPPNLYQCSWNAMLATEHVLIPVPPEDFGTQGLRAVHQAIGNARKLNPGLRRMGHLITLRDSRLLIHQSYEERLRILYKEMVLNTTISDLSAFKTAVSSRQPVVLHSPNSAAAASMKELVEEIQFRIKSKSGQSKQE